MRVQARVWPDWPPRVCCSPSPGLGVVHEGLALSGDVYTSVLAIGRAAAPLAPSRNGPAFAESRL